MADNDATETVATFELDGLTYEIDHLGICFDSQYGVYAVYCGGQQVGHFDTEAAGFRPEYRPALPDVETLIEMAKAAVEMAEREDFDLLVDTDPLALRDRAEELRGELERVSAAGHGVLDAYQRFLDTDDLEVLRRALTGLQEALPAEEPLTLDQFSERTSWSLGTRVQHPSKASIRGSIVKRGGRIWVNREKLPMVRWDGFLDAEEVRWEDLRRV